MTRALLLLIPLLGCSASGPAPSAPTAPLPLDELRPQHMLHFGTADPTAPWARFLVTDEATGEGRLRILSSDEYVPLVRVHAAEVGEDVIGVRATVRLRTNGAPGRLRWSVQRADSTGTVANVLGRIVRPEEIPADTWTELHGQVDLPRPASPGDVLTVLLWNEGHAALALDDATITFVSRDVPGRRALPPDGPLDTAAAP